MVNPSRIRASQAQKQIVKEQVSEIQFENPQISLNKSLEFMKKLTLVGMSSILFLRGVLPADAFSKKKLGGHEVYILDSRKYDVADTKIMSEWIKNAFDLINSQHLKKLMLVMNQGEVTLEMYSFSFTYNDDTVSCSGEIDGEEVQLCQGLPADISKSVDHMIRSILTITTCLKPLHDDCELSMRLLVDESTPPEPVLSVFQLSPQDSKLLFPEEETSTEKLGKIETKFQTLTVTTKFVLFPSENSEKEETSMSQAMEDEVPSSQEPYGLSASILKISQLDISQLASSDNKEHENNSELPVVNKISEYDTTLSEEISLVSLREKKVACICEISDLLDDIIRCVSCNTYQHKICYKMLESHKVKDHICVRCHNPDQEKICSVPELINDNNRKESALYRQALMYCCNNPRVSCNRIMTYLKVPRRVAEKIFRQLEDEECFNLASNNGNIRYVKEGLKESIGHHFSHHFCSDSAPMDAQILPLSPQSSKVSVGGKRLYDEAKENFSPPSASCSAPTQPKMLKTSTKAHYTYLY